METGKCPEQKQRHHLGESSACFNKIPINPYSMKRRTTSSLSLACSSIRLNTWLVQVRAMEASNSTWAEAWLDGARTKKKILLF
jgi:hypothetical protein